MTNFATNYNKFVLIKLFAFLAIKNLYFYISFNIVKLFNTSTCEQIFKQKVLNISRNMQITQKFT